MLEEPVEKYQINERWETDKIEEEGYFFQKYITLLQLYQQSY